MKKVVALLSPVLLALLIVGYAKPHLHDEEFAKIERQLGLKPLKADSAQQLENVFTELEYQWPPHPGTTIPAVAVSALPSDLIELRDTGQKKSLFFRSLLPIVLAENEQIMGVRSKLIELFSKDPGKISDSDWQWLGAIADRYRIRGELDKQAIQAALLRRVDVVPPALALAQAANESAWGTSRFATAGNNLFGQWTYNQTKGIVPDNRPVGATYAVRTFSSIDASVRGYLYNLNTNRAYALFRVLREQMRKEGRPLDGHELAVGLEAYSARGQAYIEEIRRMIRGNRLNLVLEGLTLREIADDQPQPPPVEAPAATAG